MELGNQVLADVWEHPEVRALCPLTDEQVREKTSANWIDRVEALGTRYPQIDCPLEHVFTPGLLPGQWIYRRTIHMRRGLMVTSKLHRTEHQFVVTKGRCVVWSPDGSEQIIEAGHLGITPAGTRRVLLIEEDMVWSTYHPVDSQDLRKIEDQVILPHDFKAGLELSDRQLTDLAIGNSESFRDALQKLLK